MCMTCFEVPHFVLASSQANSIASSHSLGSDNSILPMEKGAGTQHQVANRSELLFLLPCSAHFSDSLGWKLTEIATEWDLCLGRESPAPHTIILFV